jgi:DNA-binding GntR family transcriptional regulator
VTTISDPSSRLNRASLGRQIAEAIRSDILFGRIPPETPLTQQELCERFGTSRMPVRDALRELTHTGLVTVDETGHTQVAPVKRSDLRDTYLVQGKLHGLATRMATEKASDEEISELREMHNAMVDAEQSDDSEKMAQVNHQFHRRINQLADSPRLLAVLKTLSALIPQHYAPEMPKWMKRANAEHAEVLHAMEAREAEQAAEMMESHVTAAVEDLIAYLEEKEFSFSDG